MSSVTGAMRRLLDYYRAPRVLGLDLLRIAASLTIVAYHGSTQASFYNRGPLRHGYLAVDIFFVLSGFLLTRQALKLRRGLPLRTFAPKFWIRRWFRIIPAYWVMLVVIALGAIYLPIRVDMTPGDLPRHLLFLQTLLPPNRYQVTWSLVTEEWFYLALPFVLAAFILVRKRTLRVAAVVIALLVPSVVRAVMVQHGQNPVLPQARFDGLVIGAALAAVWSFAPQWKGRLLANRGWLLAVGLLGAAVMLVATTRLQDGMLYWTAGLLAFNLFIGMTLPAMTVLQWPRFLPVALAAFVTFLSDLTFPLYLVHDFAYTLVDMTGIHAKALYFTVALPMILLAAIALHFAVERPFLAWRARIDSSAKRSLTSDDTLLAPLQPAGAPAVA